MPQDLSSYSRLLVCYVHCSSLVSIGVSGALVCYRSCSSMYVSVCLALVQHHEFSFSHLFAAYTGKEDSSKDKKTHLTCKEKWKTTFLNPSALRCLSAAPHVPSFAVMLTECMLVMSCSLITLQSVADRLRNGSCCI